MHQDILPRVIFSPGDLALELCSGLKRLGAEVTLFTPGPVKTEVKNITADLTSFDEELKVRGDTYIELLKKHPLVFISLARQAQSEVLARAFEMANDDKLDIVHVYANEEDLALPFSKLCRKPVVFTHHDPFNFLVKYRNVFPKYAHLNWISMSMAQRTGMPKDTHWVANIPHGLAKNRFRQIDRAEGRYLAYLGRIVEPKGLHLAIHAVKKYNETAKQPYALKFAGKHYSGATDDYWQKFILPMIDGRDIQYVGFIGDDSAKQSFLGNADALIVPSTFDEPFGMVMIEALACGTPIIGLGSGAIPEVVKDKETGVIVSKIMQSIRDPKSGRARQVVDADATSAKLAEAISSVSLIDRQACRNDFEQRFSIERMCRLHFETYERLVTE